MENWGLHKIHANYENNVWYILELFVKQGERNHGFDPNP